jgi:holo-[acyl-carrier protein] synthase
LAESLGRRSGFFEDQLQVREQRLDRFGERFTNRVYTEIERSRSERKPDRAASYAKRFAAKEACAKALGTGFAQGVFMSDLGVINHKGGRPGFALTGGAAARLVAMTPPGLLVRLDLTMTDEYPYAQAIVIISAVRLPG